MYGGLLAQWKGDAVLLVQHTEERLSEPNLKSKRKDRVSRRAAYFFRLFRVRSWWDKFLLVAGAATLLTLVSVRSVNPILLGAFAVLSGLLLIHAYVLNDLCDAAYDALVGRDTAELSDRDRRIVVLVSAAVATLVLIVCFPAFWPLMFGAAYLLMSLFYSARPVRLKGRGLAGVIVAAFAQRPLLLLIFSSFHQQWDFPVLLLVIWLFSGGLIAMFGHQVRDRFDDRKTGVRTFAMRRGRQISLALCGIFALCFIASCLLPFCFLSSRTGLILGHGMILLSVIIGLQCLKGIRSIRIKQRDVAGTGAQRKSFIADDSQTHPTPGLADDKR